LNPTDRVIKRAEKLYNYGQVHTRDRTRAYKKRPRKIRKNRNEKK
jgi:hypothetical protein